MLKKGRILLPAATYFLSKKAKEVNALVELYTEMELYRGPFRLKMIWMITEIPS